MRKKINVMTTKELEAEMDRKILEERRERREMLDSIKLQKGADEKMTNLTVLEGGKNKLTSHIYEVHDSEGHIVDVLRFHTPEDAAEFQSGIKGDYFIKSHTLTVEELLDVVLDLYNDELLGDEDDE